MLVSDKLRCCRPVWRQWTTKGQAVSIHITGSAAVKLHGVVDKDRLIGSGLAHRSRVLGGNRHRIRRAVHRSIVDDQLHGVVAGDINIKDGFHGLGVGQYCVAAARFGDKGPLKGQAVPIHITGTTSVKLHRVIDSHRLIRSGIGHRRGVLRRNRHRIRCAVHRSIVDDQLHRVSAGDINIKDGFHGLGVGQRCAAAARFGDKGPRKGQAVPINITGTAAVKLHRVIDSAPIDPLRRRSPARSSP